MAVVVVALMIMICSAVVSIAPASSCVGSGPSEDRAEDEALGHGKSAEANSNGDGTKEEGLHCGPNKCEQHDAEKQRMFHREMFIV